MEVKRIIHNWFNVLRNPDEALPEIEEIELSDGIKSLIMGFAIPASVISLLLLSIAAVVFLLAGGTSFMSDTPPGQMLGGGTGFLIAALIYIILLSVFFIIIFLFYTVFAVVVRLLCRFTGGAGSMKEDLAIIYFMGGALVGITGIIYSLISPIWILLMFIPLLGIIISFVFYIVLLGVICFISGSYLGVLFEVLSRIENKSLVRVGGILGVAYAAAFIIIYGIIMLIYIVFIIAFFASIIGAITTSQPMMMPPL